MLRGSRNNRSRKKLNQSKNNSKKIQPTKVGEQMETTLCALCGIDGEGHLVACDDCGKWFHFQCVQIEHIGEEDDWSCAECKSKGNGKESLSQSNIQEPREAEAVTIDHNNDGPSVSPNKMVNSISQTTQHPVNEETNSLTEHNHKSVLESVLKSVNRMINSASKNTQSSTLSNYHSQCPQSQLDISIGGDQNTREDRKMSTGSGSQVDANQKASSLDDIDISRNQRPSGGWKRDASSGILSSTVTAKQRLLEPIRPGRLNENVDPKENNEGAKLTREAVQSLDQGTSTHKRSTASNTISSSRRRVAIEIQRLEAERELQTKMDEEQLSLKLEALKLKENRERTFLQEKFRIMEEESSTKKSESQYTESTTHSKLASTWIEKQRKQVLQSDTMCRELNTSQFEKEIARFNYDVSIPIDDDERDQMRGTTIQNNSVSRIPELPYRKPTVFESLDPKTISINEGEADRIWQNAVQRKITSQLRSEPARQENQVLESIDPSAKTVSQRAQSSNPNAKVFNANLERTEPERKTGGVYEGINQNPIAQYVSSNRNRDESSDPRVQLFDRHASQNQQYQHQQQGPINRSHVNRSTHTQGNFAQPDQNANNWNSGQQYNQNIENQGNFAQPGQNANNWNFGQQYNQNIENQGSFARLNQNVNNQNSGQPNHHANQRSPSQRNQQNYGMLSENQYVGYANETPTSALEARRTLTANQIAARHTVAKKLPWFYGDPSEWPAFIQKYTSTTNSCGLDNTENLDRLFECLKGNARDIVKSQLTMPKCVPSIIETLAQKYGRPEIIIKSLLMEIRAEPQIKADKLETLSNFGYKVENLCKSIQRQRMDFYLYNPEVVQEIVDKLPHQTKIDWARYSCELSPVTLISLAEWLMKLSRSINRITTPEVTPRPERKSGQKSENTKSGYVNAHDEKPKNGNKSKCEICSKDCKSIGGCPKFKGLTVDERWKSIYNNRAICRRCLQIHGRNCSSTKECGVNGCVAKHHTLLHNEEKARKKSLIGTANKANNNGSVESRTGTAESANSHEHCNAHRGGQSVFYKIIPVNLKHKDKSVSTHAYMDDGSGLTLMEEGLAHELGLTGTPESLCLRWTSGTVRHEKDSMRVELNISGNNDGDHEYRVRNTRTVKSLDLPIQNIDRESLTKKYPYLSRVPFQEFNARPRILIGLDNIKLGLSRESVEGGWIEPVVSRTLLGWVVHGPHGLSSGNNNHHMQHHVLSISCSECPCQAGIDQDLHRQIEEHFSLENFGIRAITNVVESKEIQRARKIMEETITRKNGCFEIGLLWKYDNVKLPNSYPMAIKRLECQDRKMLANPALMENINNQIRDFVAKGYIRKLTPEEINIDDPRICYLPLFHHLDPKKPAKVRMVWDAAAKVKGISLNSPDNLVALIDILRRFREKRIAIGGDIQEMFHQIRIRHEDQNSQRFLWRNGNSQIAPDIYVMQVMTFGANCSPSCAQFVKNRNATDFESEYPKAAEAIKTNHYVDDWLDCQHTVEETIQLAKDVRHVHQKGGFKLTKFISNSKEVLSAMGENGDQESKDLNINTVTGTQKVLGMWWDSQTDCFTYSLKFTKLNKELLTRPPTKRELLKALMSIYDPLGLIAFFLVYLKMLLQEIWKAKLGWDVPITEELSEKWNKWLKLLPKVEEVRIPRLYSRKISPGTARSIVLHVFVDASENAYCAVCYLRIQDEDGVECVLVEAKTKVAPIKPILTIPRKELLAAVLGTRLAKSIAASLTIKIDRRIFWSDSRDVLCWIRSTTRRYRQFVAFRVGEILETSIETEWRWVPGKLNVADEGTKWCKLPSFNQDCRWFRGPEFLWKGESHWPEDLTKNETTDEELHVHFVHTKTELPSGINPARFSQWWTMLKAQAFSTHYVKQLMAKCRGASPLSGNLKSNEIKAAEYTLYRIAQADCFSEEIKTLKNAKDEFGDKSYVHKSSSIYKISPYLEEDGLLRVRGRIDNISQVTFDTKRPIILPREHIITELIVTDYHTRYLHQNHKTVLNEIVQKYYIPKLRVVLNSVIAKCQVCKNNRTKPIAPTMGDLPKARLSPGLRPFTFTGVNYFGPMYVRVNFGTQKRWGVLFTCLTVRDIHIEIAPSLTTDSCIMCIRNFIAIRGTPREFYSDNGTNFRGADTELRKELKKLDLETIESRFTRSYSKWIFNPPSSPSMGGSWERLIASVKSNLSHVMPIRTPQEELLRSYLMEVTNIVNSHPLTHVEPPPANKLAVLDVAGKKEIKEVRPVDDQVTKMPTGEENVENVSNTVSNIDTDHIPTKNGNTNKVTRDRKLVKTRSSQRIAAKNQYSVRHK